MIIEKKILLYYPLPTYFWFANSSEGSTLAHRVEEGFKKIMKDGSYKKIFDKYYSDKISLLNLKERHIFRIENHLLPENVPFKNTDYWYDPLSSP